MKITKEQILSFLKYKRYFIEDDIIFHVESEKELSKIRLGIAYKFDKHGYLIDVYTWDD